MIRLPDAGDQLTETSPSSILLVDDDPAILEGVADLLELYGYDVTTAIDGHMALQSMQHTVPDLVISDIMMPTMDGYEFFEAVRDNPAWTPIPFIFLTARGQRTDIRRGQSLGADAYLTKPFEPEDLIIAVNARLKRARDVQQAAQANVEDMKQRLITIFSHELRTPLAYIYGYVNLLREQHNELTEDNVEQMLEGAHRGTQRLVDLVEDLMLLVQIESGIIEMEIGLERGQMSIREIVETAVEKHLRYAQERGITLSIDISPEVSGYRYSMYVENALARLLSNAIKFCRKDTGEVVVTSERRDERVLIHVKDNGIGIAPAKQKIIFERFQQVNREVMEQQGVGLGLTLARALIRLHHGDVTLISEPGEGSTFTIELPSHVPSDGVESAPVG